MSSRRIVSAGTVALACGVLTVLTAPPAPATGPASSATGSAPLARPGKARAVTAELDLDVRLLDNSVVVPVEVSLNKAESPAQLDGTVLTAVVDGVGRSGPVTLVKADVGRSVTRADAEGAAASVTLARADVHAPGLPGTTLLGLEALSASATCPVDGQPAAEVTAPAGITVLGKPVTVGLYGPTKVDVPLVGSVSVEFSRKTTTSTTAAASALEVQVSVDPLDLNVAKVTGTVTVASVSCEKPVAAGRTPTPTPTQTQTRTPGQGAAQTPAGRPAADTTPSAAAVPPAATGTSSRRPAAATAPAATPDNLAATGGNGATAPLAAGAAALVAAGACVLRVTRRRRAAAPAHARRP
ncbi:SCO1860 family LAETG-anchored protein [Kitasatospora sp. NPDC056327]|uniref:SCO1860 family LAETG-anchored protein n=1 Tax=Kitasatospora sp. NPDC056327 TaxID=3345785 RepID=UPI0035DCAAB5